MNIQIFGKKKCFDTKKTERWFKERRIKFQQIDLVRFGMSGGEFDSVLRAVGGVDTLIDWSVKSPEIDLMRYTDDTRQRKQTVRSSRTHADTHRPKRQAGHGRVLPGDLGNMGMKTNPAERNALHRIFAYLFVSPPVISNIALLRRAKWPTFGMPCAMAG